MGVREGAYTLGNPREVEARFGCRLHERFDLMLGTSTVAIMAALLAQGHSVDDVHVVCALKPDPLRQTEGAVE